MRTKKSGAQPPPRVISGSNLRPQATGKEREAKRQRKRKRGEGEEGGRGGRRGRKGGGCFEERSRSFLEIMRRFFRIVFRVAPPNRI